MWVPWKFSRVPEYAHGYFSRKFSRAFVPIDPMNVRTKFEVRSFTCSWDNSGVFYKIGQSLDTPTLPFLQILNGLLFILTLWMYRPNLKSVAMYRPNLKSVALPVPEIIAIEVLGGGCEPQSWGRRGRKGSRIIQFERALVSSYRLSVVTFLLPLRVSEILPLLYSSTPLFTPHLLSPHNLPMFSWE